MLHKRSDAHVRKPDGGAFRISSSPHQVKPITYFLGLCPFENPYSKY